MQLCSLVCVLWYVLGPRFCDVRIDFAGELNCLVSRLEAVLCFFAGFCLCRVLRPSFFNLKHYWNESRLVYSGFFVGVYHVRRLEPPNWIVIVLLKPNSQSECFTRISELFKVHDGVVLNRVSVEIKKSYLTSRFQM